MASAPFGTLEPTLEGYFVHDAQDALAIIQLVLKGKLAIAHRRPKDPERQYVIKSGNVFVFKEMKGHIQRWTDGVTWSASRILTPFLVYRQDSKVVAQAESTSGVQKNLSKSGYSSRFAKTIGVRPGKHRKLSSSELIPSSHSAVSNMSPSPNEYYADDGYYTQVSGKWRARSHETIPESSLPYTNMQFSAHGYFGDERASQRPYGRQVLESHDVDYDLFGSLKDADFAEDGLAKKTISVKYQGVPYRLISYFTKPDVIEGRLKRPTNEPMFRNIVIEKELWESVQENKTPLDMSELYFSNAQNQYPALAPIQPYSGYASLHQMPYSSYLPEAGSQQAPLDSSLAYQDVGPRSGEDAGPRVSNIRLSQHMPIAQSSAYSLYSHTAAAPPPQWYGDNSGSQYQFPGLIPYGTITGKPEDHAAPNLQIITPEAPLRRQAQDISDIYARGNYDASSRYVPHSVPISDPVFTDTGHHHNNSSVRTSGAAGSGATELPQNVRSSRQQGNYSMNATASQAPSETLSETIPLAETLDESAKMSTHHELLPSISPDASPLEPPIRTGISANTFIPRDFDYGDPENSVEVRPANQALDIRPEGHDSRSNELRSQFSTRGHGPRPSATPSKPGSNVYFSTGRAWS